jgi:hypothetical protein
VLTWPTSATDGPALFSLRPESLRIAAGSTGAVCFSARVRDQVFHGANELWRVECADGQILTLRTAARPLTDNQVELEFSPADAVPVRPSEERV